MSNKTDFNFNDIQYQIFEGCMLGDGGLQWCGNNCCFFNVDVHEDYLRWLQKQLGVEDISKVKPKSEDGFIYFYRLRTRVIPSIRDEFKRWYPYDTREGTNQNKNNKIIPKDVELTLIKLLFWYIGDGYYDKRDNVANFSNYLTFDDWELLSRKVRKLLDVDDGISVCKHGKDSVGRQRYMLRLNNFGTWRLFDLIDNLDFNIPECYQYKFGRWYNG